MRQRNQLAAVTNTALMSPQHKHRCFGSTRNLSLLASAMLVVLFLDQSVTCNARSTLSSSLSTAAVKSSSSAADGAADFDDSPSVLSLKEEKERPMRFLLAKKKTPVTKPKPKPTPPPTKASETVAIFTTAAPMTLEQEVDFDFMSEFKNMELVNYEVDAAMAGPEDGNPATTDNTTVSNKPKDAYKDPLEVGQYVQIGKGNVVAVHLLPIPGTNKFFFMERPSGRHPDGGHNIVGVFDYDTYKFKNMAYGDSVFCAGHSVTQDGHVVVVGGHIAKAGYGSGLKAIRVFDRFKMTFTRIADMTFPRWYPSGTLLPNGKIVIMGGTRLPGSGSGKNPKYEVWDPSKPKVTAKAKQSPGMMKNTNDIYYPNNYVLQNGQLWTFCNKWGEIIEGETGEVMQRIPAWNEPHFTEYPFTGTSVMLGLRPEDNYTAEIVYFGGQFGYGWVNTTATRKAERIRAVYDPETNSFDFGNGWEDESMPLPRVMPDATLLPNGHVIILNGAMKGLAGDNAGTKAKANEPNLWAIEYNPYAEKGSRFTTLQRSMIPRLYHSTAALTTDGSILVSGCDRCDRYWCTTTPYSRSPTSYAEYRVEVFRPPIWFRHELKPEIVSVDEKHYVPSDPDVYLMQYGKNFTLNYEIGFVDGSETNETMTITGAVLLAPGSTTHSTNMNQRLVNLKIYKGKADRQLLVTGPPDGNIAPPGLYMLFLLNGDVYGSAVWVRLPGTNYLTPQYFDGSMTPTPAPVKKKSTKK